VNVKTNFFSSDVRLVCFFLALRNQLGDIFALPPPPHAHTHTNTQVANQQQARLVYLGRGNTSVHVQDTTSEAGSAGSAVHGGEEEREEKTEEERGGGLVSASGGADVGVAVAFRETTHDAALCFRVV